MWDVVYFFCFLIHYVYLQWCRWDRKLLLEKGYLGYNFEYELEGDTKQATAYQSPNQSKHLLVFLSGAYNLGFHAYIQKVMWDIETTCPLIAQKYTMVCFEKYDQSSIIIYDDVAAWIDKFDTELGGIEELVLMGFSSGGVIASHVMQRLKHRNYRKKIITYDTPWQVQENVESFAQNALYRPDWIFYQMVHHTYSTHFDRDRLHDCLHVHDHRWCKGAHELVDIIKRAHRYTDAEMYTATGWNFDQTPDTAVFNIHTTHDPFVDRDVHDRFVQANQDKINFEVVTLRKPIWGHTCDMAFSTEYLQELTFAICV
jgi:pimeloyl-ACP methyl ester carboxylesterase